MRSNVWLQEHSWLEATCTLCGPHGWCSEVSRKQARCAPRRAGVTSECYLALRRTLLPEMLCLYRICCQEQLRAMVFGVIALVFRPSWALRGPSYIVLVTRDCRHHAETCASLIAKWPVRWRTSSSITFRTTRLASKTERPRKHAQLQMRPNGRR